MESKMSKQDLIVTALADLQPEHLEVLDESHMHSRGLETHYKAVIVSPLFAGLNAVKRHQKVYATVGELMALKAGDFIELELLERIVACHAPPGGLVADLCCGSGTTLVAAASAGRRAIGADLGALAQEVAGGRLLAAGLGLERWTPATD
jgi:stress-induced morphogen